MASNRRRHATAAQLRDDIDSGHTGDKVDFPDPAAAPLGTDDEAAGRSPAPETISAARRAERSHAPSRASGRGGPSGKLAIALLTLVGAAVVAAALALS